MRRRRRIQLMVSVAGLVIVLLAAAPGDGQVRVPAIPPPPPPRPADESQIERPPTAQNEVPQAPAPDPCAIPTWLSDESARVDGAVVRLLRLQKIDPAEYAKNAPANCAQQLLKYRVSVLGRVVDVMEGK